MKLRDYRNTKVSEKIIRMVKIFYEDLKCAVEDKEEIGEWFDIENGVKQRFNMSGLFNPLNAV